MLVTMPLPVLETVKDRGRWREMEGGREMEGDEGGREGGREGGKMQPGLT